MDREVCGFRNARGWLGDPSVGGRGILLQNARGWLGDPSVGVGETDSLKTRVVVRQIVGETDSLRMDGEYGSLRGGTNPGPRHKTRFQTESEP